MPRDDNPTDAELYRAMRRDSQERRARNREFAPGALEAAGLPFTSHNDGVHLIVDQRYDFWPGTGKWVRRGAREAPSGRGIFNLIKHAKEHR